MFNKNRQSARETDKMQRQRKTKEKQNDGKPSNRHCTYNIPKEKERKKNKNRNNAVDKDNDDGDYEGDNDDDNVNMRTTMRMWRPMERCHDRRENTKSLGKKKT